MTNKSPNLFDVKFKDTLDGSYKDHLQTLNGVKFTRREIEVVACLLSGRSQKSTASILDVSTRTVEAHIYNVFKKLDVNSKECLINFIEKTGQLFAVKNFYIQLLLHSNFEKRLKKIAALSTQKGSILIVGSMDGIPEKIAFLKDLENTFKRAGLKTSLSLKDQPFSVSDLQNLHKNRQIDTIIYFLPNHKTQSLQPQEFENLPFPVICLVENESALTSPLASKGHINCKDYADRYELYFTILKMLLREPAIGKIVDDSMSRHKTTQSSLRSPSDSNSTKEDKRGYPFLSFFKLANPRLLIGIISLCVLGFLILKWAPTKEYPHSSVRSELPIPGQAYFLERPTIISQMSKELQHQKGIRTLALIGMGGVGKTTLARHYARSLNADVVWEINAETPENLSRSFESLAESLGKTEEDRVTLDHLKKIKNDAERTEKLFSFIKNHLRLHPNWILIYDNVEQFSDIKAYFPYDQGGWGIGDVILTTRNSNIKDCTYVNASLKIPDLSLDERVALFQKTQNEENVPSSPTDKKNLEEFLKQVPPFPLDVRLSAHYLKNTKMAYGDYLTDLYQNNPHIVGAHEEILASGDGYDKTRYSLVKLSIEKMLQKNPEFKDLLLLLTLVDSQSIPKFLFESYKDTGLVNDFIKDLHRYSLIAYDPSSSPQTLATFSIHRSTQEMIRTYLVQNLHIKIHDKSLSSLSDTLEKLIFSLVLSEDFPKMRLLLGHVEAVLRRTSFFTEEQRGYIGCQLIGFYLLLGSSGGIETLQSSYNLLQKSKGAQPKASKVYSKIANILVYRGIAETYAQNYEKAIKSIQEGLSIYRDDFPDGYWRIAWALEHLGRAYVDLGKYKAGVRVLEESSAILRTHFPEDSARISNVLITLGRAHSSQGAFLKAKNIFEEVHTMHAQNLGNTYPRIISWNLGHIGNAYRDLGDYAKAQELLQEGQNLMKTHHPEKSHNILWFSIHLGSVFTENGELTKAETLLKGALEYCEKHLPPYHSRTFLAKYHLGNLYQASGNLKKAKAYLEESLSYTRQTYGQKHTETAHVLRSLAKVYLAEGKLETAENLLMQSLAVLKENDHSEVYRVYEGLADFHLKIAERHKDAQQAKTFHDKAADYLRQAIAVVKAAFGEDSPHLSRLSSKLRKLEL